MRTAGGFHQRPLESARCHDASKMTDAISDGAMARQYRSPINMLPGSLFGLPLHAPRV